MRARFSAAVNTANLRSFRVTVQALAQRNQLNQQIRYYGRPRPAGQLPLTEVLRHTPLSESVRLEMVQVLLAAKADPNLADDEGTPLHTGPPASILRVLLDAKADPNITDHNSSTPLHAAVRKGQLEDCRMLLMAKAKPNTPDINGHTPLDICTHPRVMHLLLRGVCTGERDGLKLQNRASVSNILRLAYDAVTNVRPEALQLYVRELARRRRLDCPLTGITLLEHSIRTTMSDARTHPKGVVSLSRVKMFELILQAKPNLDARCGAALHTCAQLGWLDGAKALLMAKVDVNMPNTKSGTPLFTSTRNGHFEFTRFLLEAKVDPNLCAEDGSVAFTVSPGLSCKDIKKMQTCRELVQTRLSTFLFTALDLHMIPDMANIIVAYLCTIPTTAT